MPVLGKKEGNMFLHTHMVSITFFYYSLTWTSDKDSSVEDSRHREPTSASGRVHLDLICGPGWSPGL